jgi:hypothetical protein
MGGRWWGHSGGVCAVWKPCALDWSHMGARFHHLEGGWYHTGAVYSIIGSQLHQTSGAGTVWESDGTMWDLHVTYKDHVRAVCTVWVLCAPYWRQMVLYGSHMHCLCALCWSHVCHTGALWQPDGAMWEANGAICKLHGSPMGAIWEWCVLYGSHVCHIGTGWSLLGGVCCHRSSIRAIGELCAPYRRQMTLYESCIHCMGGHMGAGTAWEQWAQNGSQMQPHGRWVAP